MKYCKSTELDGLQPLPESVSFCATVNDSGDEQVVTDMMVRRACDQADDMQIWPYSVQGGVYMPAAASINSSSAMIIPFPTPGSRN